MLQAEVRIAIDSIGKAKVSRSEMEVGPREALTGTLRFDRQESEALTVQIAQRKVKEEGWSIQEAALRIEASSRETRWRINGVAFGDDITFDDCGESFEMIAMAAARPLPQGLLDDATLRGSAVVSEPVRVRRRDCEFEPSEEPTPKIQIHYIDQSPVRSGINEVRLQETLHGEVIKPPDAVVRLVVQPLSGTDRWVMTSDPQISGRRWNAIALFGREGLDEWDDFLLYAVVTGPRLPTGRGIPPAEWLVLSQKVLLAVSPEILVRRVELPAPRGGAGGSIGDTGVEVALRIHALEDTVVDDRNVWPVDRKSGIIGTMEGRSLSLNEDVWILITERFEGSTWRVLGKASLLGNRYWQMPPKVLGEPGQFLDLIAVLSKERVETLSDYEIKKNMPFSRRVHLVIKDRPPLEVIFTSIDGRAVGGQDELIVAPLSSLQGVVAGRPVEEGEKVWIFKTTKGAAGEWELLVHGSFINKHIWAVPPMYIGRAGERLILLAVVSKEELRDLKPETHSQIVAFSDKVHITLQPELERR